MDLHQLLDFEYGGGGDDSLRRLLANGAEANARAGPDSETPLHVATRRRRLAAVEILLDHGADVDAKTASGKTAWAHAARRGFAEVAALLSERGASTDLNHADRLALAMSNLKLEEAQRLLDEHPGIACTGNPEEDRLLADVAGRNQGEPVALLIEAGANLAATGLDSGTALHQAAWFGQPANAQLLIQAGAALDHFDSVHGTSPLGWAVHGSRYSGGADEREQAYVQVARLLLDAGSSLFYPGQPDSNDYLVRLHRDASPKVRDLLPSVSAP